MRAGWITGAALAIAVAASAADAPVLRTLSQVRLGQWMLRDTDGAAPSRPLCVARVEQFVLLDHGTVGCTRRIIDDTPPHATVQFLCPGRGTGRTSVTAETPELVTIEAQGMDGGAPFDQRLEARWRGACVSR